jgi:thymidylate kinase
MKILILEGIPTSGKSTLTGGIKEQLRGLTVRVATEAETHEPIMKQKDELHIPFFENLIEKLVAEKPGLIIFDRLYLTQAFRAHAKLTEYSAIENLLSEHDTLTVFLAVDKQAIAGRITKAVVHRDSSPDDSFEWGEYFKTKGKTDDEITEYYSAQQRNQITLLGASTLPHMICNTTHHDYSGIAQQILKKLQLK